MKRIISITVLTLTAMTLIGSLMTLDAKEVTKSDGTKVSMCYTHAKKWHPCAIQAK